MINDLETAKKRLSNIITLLRDDSPQPLEERHITDAREEAKFAIRDIEHFEQVFRELTKLP